MKETIKEYKYGNATIVVYRPILADDERQKRERQIQTALNLFGKEMVKAGLKTN